MKQLSSLLLMISIFSAWPLPALAVTPNGNVEELFFDVEKAEERLAEISLKISAEPLEMGTLNQAIEELNQMAKEANQCVQVTAERIHEVDEQIQRYFGDDEQQALLVDAEYLENQKEALTKKQAQCRLFMIRANERLGEYRRLLLARQQEIAFTRGANILQRLQQLPVDWRQVIAPGIKENKTQTMLFLALPAFLLAGFLSWRLQTLMRRKWQKNLWIFSLNMSFLFLAFFFLSNLLFVQEPYDSAADNQLFNRIMLVGLLYAATFFFYNFLFLSRRTPLLLARYGFDTLFIRRLGLTILTFYFLHQFGFYFLSLIQAGTSLTQFFKDLILIASLVAMAYFVLVLHHRSEWFKGRISGSLLYKAIALIVFILLLFNFVGFFILSVHAAYILFSLLLVGTLATVLFLGVNNVYHLLSYNMYYQSRLKNLFGYSTEPPFIELLMLKILALMILLIASCFLFAQLIGEAGLYIDNFLDHLMDGFKIGNMEVTPLPWMTGIFFFCLLSLFSRYLSTRISRSQQFDEEEEKQVAVASITLYAGLALAVIVGLLFAGFGFTNLAIIAGALSVGIGLGLQSIVNNFFSGLILLVEKPIKPGDRIQVDGIEGFVKKIRIRSTQIVTNAQEDIIIPNSDLITHQVINYMFNDKYWRVKCEIGVAYGSDTDLVREVMISVANAHPDVVKGHKSKPIVLFREFGDSALKFELWCLIRDVNRKFRVVSELNFALDKACRKHNIEIAFPQRDVHIKFDDANLPCIKNKKEE